MATQATIAIARGRQEPWVQDGVERLAAVLLPAALLPVLAVCAALIFAVSRRPPPIAHPRGGRDGAAFRALKLRTGLDLLEAA